MRLFFTTGIQLVQQIGGVYQIFNGADVLQVPANFTEPLVKNNPGRPSRTRMTVVADIDLSNADEREVTFNLIVPPELDISDPIVLPAFLPVGIVVPVFNVWADIVTTQPRIEFPTPPDPVTRVLQAVFKASGAGNAAAAFQFVVDFKHSII